MNYVIANEKNSNVGTATASVECTGMQCKVPKMRSALDADIEFFNGNVLDYYCFIALLKARLKI